MFSHSFMNIVMLVKIGNFKFLDNECDDTRNVAKLIEWIWRKHLVIL